MKIFTIFGDLIIKTFSLVGALILEIPNIPNRLRGINTKNLKDRIDTDKIRENVSQIKNDVKIEDKISKISKTSKMSKTETADIFIVNKKEKTESEVHEFEVNGDFTPKEKEKTIFQLQIVSLAFLVVSVIYLFNFLSFIVYAVLGVLLIGYLLRQLFSKVKLMYSADFNAYRDFFLMYIVAGIILILAGSNPNLVMAFSFQFFPNLTILIFAVIEVIAIFLIFRIRYHRNYTFGTVIEKGKKTAHVKVEYDIRSNVKPDMYIVENNIGADEGEIVKLQIEEKLLSNNGNKPVSIIETVKQ